MSSHFISSRRIAVAGASGTPGGNAGNIVDKRLRASGYQVFAVNPNAEEVAGDPCYRELGAIPDRVEAVVFATAPDAAEATMRACIEPGITQVWMHRSFGTGSVCPTAADLGRQHGVPVIEGGCPLMFAPTADRPHRVLRHVCTWTGNVPRTV